ncbi:phage tail protein [Desulfosarcina sp. OttesenSCG-928-G10]|nr:phage tail protein [Desulfosarcina sp. OttesenSCG-928-G10]MDL2322105.1 phage tail protein [Desulfosarcina sp. OttesenSCG-928-B08]
MIFTEAAIRANSQAMIAASGGRRNIKKTSFSMFTNPENASWALYWTLSEASCPIGTYQITVGRKAFQLKPGDLFKLTYTPDGLEDVVCRIQSIEEEGLDSERFVITAVEAIEYKSTIPVVGLPASQAVLQSMEIAPLTHFIVREPPYIYASTPNTVVPIVARETGTELGAIIYISVDGGSSYSRIGVVRSFSVHGTLKSDMTATDDSIGVDFGLDVGRLSSDDEAVQKLKNLVLVGDEIICFTTIEPDPDGGYILSGLSRGMLDTAPASHSQGDDLFSIDGLSAIQSALLSPGATYFFKAVPYNAAKTGDISEAAATSLVFTNLSSGILPVEGLSANGQTANPTYTTDINLTWTPQVRDSSTPPYDLLACDGLFEVRVKVSGVQVRVDRSTTVNPFFNAWQYTQAMNLSDNGSLAGSVTFEVYNFSGSTYSPAAVVTVALDGGTP